MIKLTIFVGPTNWVLLKTHTDTHRFIEIQPSDTDRYTYIFTRIQMKPKQNVQ